jgi:hypothetical protein
MVPDKFDYGTRNPCSTFSAIVGWFILNVDLLNHLDDLKEDYLGFCGAYLDFSGMLNVDKLDITAVFGVLNFDFPDYWLVGDAVYLLDWVSVLVGFSI